MLNNVEWCYEIDDVQSFWNNMESKIVNIVDIIVPVFPIRLKVNLTKEINSPRWKKEILRMNLNHE